ncbi:MAG: hypothetical protein CM1200mP27_00700 [Chloroflexota bacterium]|nr:MAG: hypothetical protein CM1200mP27_00700 [Chloroflexota bacterium]
MDVGMMMIFSSYGWEGQPDGQMWEEELRLAEIAADEGLIACGLLSTTSTTIHLCRITCT